MPDVPAYLSDHAEFYRGDPLAAAKRWFYEARYGLFVHFGLYSLLGRHEWLQHREAIPVAGYAQLAHWFTANAFDAEELADLAVASGMKYINLTTRHHDSFCLWPTAQNAFHVGTSPCRRDLVGELAAACDKRGLGLCLYYSHGRDWKHPHAPNNDRFGGAARPEYDPAEPTYATGRAHDLGYYREFMLKQVEELLTQYGPIASVWLDGIMTPLSPKDEQGQVIAGYDPREHGDPLGCQELYDLVHRLQPQCLVSYKQGYLGTEDYFAPEHKAYNRFGSAMGPEMPGEVCTTPSGSWGYMAGQSYLSHDELWATLGHARQNDVNLLMNVGPMPDGRVPEEAVACLTAIGDRLRAEGFPDPAGLSDD